MNDYRYVIKGTDVAGKQWTVTGIINTVRQGDFALVPELAMKQAFLKLTGGQAQFGSPGVGCKGPYRFTSMLIEEINANGLGNQTRSRPHDSGLPSRNC